MEKVEAVREYYNDAVLHEWDRINRHPFEFAINKRFMDRYIKPGDKVLDVGGGPGRYSLYFAEKGCDVTLFDLSSVNVEFALQMAKEQGVELNALTGDARYIDTIVEGQFDHLLLMGPLYHLLEEKDRVQAVESCLKLLKPGGNIYAAFISSYGGIIYSMKYDQELILNKDLEYQYELFVQDKPFSGFSFTNAYFIRYKDVLPFMSQFPLEKLHYLGSESILGPTESIMRTQPKEVMDKWIDLAERVCEREDLLSYAEHLLYIGKKI